MLTKSGVKLLDFGLARLLPSVGGARSTERASDEPLTTEGAVVGTMPYMAPEQLRGESTDARSDIFAFGAVLYEALTGARAFAANSQAELAAAILEHDPPPVTARRPQAPPALDRVVATCLAKPPDDRWQRARDVLRELTWVRDDGDRRVVPVVASAPRRPRWLAAAGVAAAVAIAIAVTAAVMARRDTAAPPPPRVSFTIEPPKGTSFPRASAQIAISPDATRVAFVALSADGTSRLWIRRIDSTDSRLIAGTDGASTPFWSPDGRSLAFFARSKLVRIDESGGARQELADVMVPFGGTWAGDRILFSSNVTLHQVSASGGAVTPVTTLDPSRKERRHAWPAFLPDGLRFLYASLPADGGEPAIYQGTLGSTKTDRVLTGAMSFVLAGTRLLSLNARSLVVQTLDADRARVGEPVTLASGVGVDVRMALGAFAASGASVLAYRVVGDHSRLQWFDRQGGSQAASHDTADYQHPYLSPDATRLAIEKTDPSTGRHGVWILDLARDVTTRLLVDPSGAHGPVWSPDGQTILVISNRLGGADIYAMRADGTGEPSLVSKSSGQFTQQASDWSPDGRWIVFAERGDLWVLPMVPPGGPPQVFLNTNANEHQGRFSPDGRWMAYTSDESGVPEIYVRRFPGGEGKWRVSTTGGAQASWRGDGKELFYLAADGKLMAADVTSNAETFATGGPHALFDTGIRGLFVERRNHYVMTKDGQRFLFNLTPEDDVNAPITVVMNWDPLPR